VVIILAPRAQLAGGRLLGGRAAMRDGLLSPTGRLLEQRLNHIAPVGLAVLRVVLTHGRGL